MKRTPLMSASVAICCLGLYLPAQGEIEEAADKAVKAMSDKLGAAETFQFTAKRTLSDDLAGATGGRGSAELTTTVKRPSHVHVAAKGEESTRDFYFDGKQVTLADSTAKVYASREFSGTIDDMLDKLEEALGFSPPIGDLLVSNLHESLLGAGPSGKVGGKETIGGTECQHLAFTHPNVDWEIWIGEDHLPRKFCVKYKPEEGDADLSFVVDEIKWDLDAKVTESNFSFTAPEGAEKIEILSPDEAVEAAKKEKN